MDGVGTNLTQRSIINAIIKALNIVPIPGFWPRATVRATLEISVVGIGWYLGGTVGVGTLLFAFGIGPCVAFGLYLVDKIFN